MALDAKKVVYLADHGPHLSGPVICTRCKYEWISVRPIGVDTLECSECGAMAGMSMDTLLNKPGKFFGDDCCGQVDCDGVCAAPACAYGSQLKYAEMVRRLVGAEFGETFEEYHGS